VSSFNLLPGHVFIRNITDVDITAPAAGASKTAVGTLTHIKLQAVQLTLKDVSFWYKDKTASIGPSEFTGLMEFKLPEKGIDVDIKVRLIPNTPDGQKQRERRNGFHEIDIVEVNVAEGVELEVKQSNHAILLSMFKPVVVMRLREILAKTLAEQIRGVLEMSDSIAWDVGKRSEVFADAGLGGGSSIAAAIWSEIGRFRKMEGGFLSGWNATGTGFVKDDIDGGAGKLAMGAEPQIISGEKKGPLGTNSESLKERLPEGVDVDVDMEGGAQGIAQKVLDVGKEGKKQVLTFKRSVEVKAEEEKKTPGWRSGAFDL